MKLPSTPLLAKPEAHTLAAGTRLVRFYDPDHGDGCARRHYGPLPAARFDHHPLPVAWHPACSVWYAAPSLLGAVAEAFDRLGLVDREARRRVALVRCTHDLVLVDLVGTAARAVGADQELASSTDYVGCQVWARALYATPIGAQGLRWKGRTAGTTCVVLNDRVPADGLAVDADHALGDPAVWPRIARAARECRLAVL